MKRFHDDRGFTLVEMSVTVLLTAITLASVTTIVVGLLNDVSRQQRISEVEGEARPVLESIVVELRQAKAPKTISASRPVEELDWDKIVFYSDRRLPHPAPEMYDYELINCTNGTDGGVCDLQETIYSADTSSVPPNYTFDDMDLVSQRVVLSGVVADPDLSVGSTFSSVTWTGDPAARTAVTSCDTSIPSKRCDATLIVIDLRVQYPSELGFEPYLLHEEVRLRNAS
jgi:prepilin-type N-terminal cleavage/methylation domain-containing protein